MFKAYKYYIRKQAILIETKTGQVRIGPAYQRFYKKNMINGKVAYKSYYNLVFELALILY